MPPSAVCNWSAEPELPTTAPARTTTNRVAAARSAPGTSARGGRVCARRGDGFSFVEVIVIVALLGILLVAAVPQLFVPDELDVELAARQVASDLGLARRLAIARRVAHLVSFTPAGGPYTAYSVVATNSAVPEAGFPKELPPQVTVTGTGAITFQPSGAAAAAALITFQAGGATAQVDVVRTTGRTRVSGP